VGDDVRDWLERNPEAALRETLGEDVLAQLEAAFPNRRYFAISSKGFAAGTVEPVGLNDVLSWIYANQRRERAVAVGRRWLRPGAVAAVLLLLVWAVARAAHNYRTGPEALERQAAVQQALGQLELGGRLYAQGDHDSALAVLRETELPRDHERAVELDTLLAYVAHHVGSARILSGGSADSLLDIVLTRAARAARALRDNAEAAARVRHVQAEACMLRACDRSEIRNALEFVAANAGDPRLIGQARERLRELR
jgi:hypothetical protein